MHVEVLLLLPEGLTIPPLPYLISTLAILVGAAGLLWRRRPQITDELVVAAVPWIAAGGLLHALYQLGGFSESVAPLFGTVSVYLTVTAIGLLSWLVSEVQSLSSPRFVGGIGSLVFLSTVGYTLVSVEFGSLLVSTVSVIGAVAMTGVVWGILSRRQPTVTEVTGWTGVVVIFGHALDGLSTALGYDLLDAGERTPLSRYILEFGTDLPTAEFIGGGWVFILVKLVLPVVVVYLFVDYLRDRPSEARAFLIFIAAVGLGPAVHNLLLFATI